MARLLRILFPGATCHVIARSACISRMLLCAGLTLFCGALQAADASNGAYKVEFEYNYRWLDMSGKELEESLVQGVVYVSPSNVLIKPVPVRVDSNAAFFAWTSSPFNSNEWFTVGLNSKGEPNGYIWLDNHPTRELGDLCSYFGRTLYVPADHQMFHGLSEAERFFMRTESFSYRPEEITVQTVQREFSGIIDVGQIVAFTPNYLRKTSRSGQSEQQQFGGKSQTRKLWELSVLNRTNWHGALLPSEFRFTRFCDPDLRIENDMEVPIVECIGRLISIEAGFGGSVFPITRTNVVVVDLRFIDYLGAAVQYVCEPGSWPQTGGSQFQRMIETNRALTAGPAELVHPVPRGKRFFVILLVIMLVVPAILVGRQLTGKNQTKT